MKTDTEKLVQDAYDALDAYNARGDGVLLPRCEWCGTKGYDGIGLIHAIDCIIVRLRTWISRHS